MGWLMNTVFDAALCRSSRLLTSCVGVSVWALYAEVMLLMVKGVANMGQWSGGVWRT